MYESLGIPRLCATGIRLAVALIGAAFIGILDYYRQVPEDPPVWLDSTGEGVVVIALLVAVGAVVGSWWALALALAVVVDQVIWSIVEFVPRDGAPIPLQASNFIPVTLATALVLGAGVGARKAVGRIGMARGGARIAEGVACLVLVLTGLGCSFFALLFTGGDSAFATESGWVYAPLLVGLVLTAAAIGGTVLGRGVVSGALIGASAAAYAGTLLFWSSL